MYDDLGEDSETHVVVDSYEETTGPVTTDSNYDYTEEYIGTGEMQEISNETTAEVQSETTYAYYDDAYTEEYESEFDTYIETQTADYSAWIHEQLEAFKFDEIIGQMQTDMWVAAEEQWGFMPDVCPDGEECRDSIWVSLEAEVKQLWNDTIDHMMSDLNDLMVQSAADFEEAWNAAKNCPHGCYEECTEQTVVYTNTIERMSELEKQIAELMQEYETEVITYTEIRSECPDDVEKVEVAVHHYTDTVE